MERHFLQVGIDHLMMVITTLIYTCLGELTPEEVVSIRQQAVLSDRIFDLMINSIEIMDEVDIILHPLKSELNWPLGAKGK